MALLHGMKPGEMQQASCDTILVVEDDEDIREMLTACIESETSYHVMSLANAEEALQRFQEIKEANPRLFIIDLRLQSMTGLQLYDYLHAFQEFECVPAIIITATTLDLSLDTAIAERGLTLLLKPFDVDVLIRCIERVPIGPGQLV